MATTLDPAIPRKSRIVDDSLSLADDGMPLPSVVEISESGTCNRKCIFCPRSDPNYTDVKEFISPSLLEKLTRQLADVGYRGIFLFSGFVEPMLDKNIFSKIRLARECLPEARVEMVTNGDALNEARLLRLFESGLSTLLISVYDGKDDAIRFEAMCRAVGLTDSQYVIRHRYLSSDQKFGITLSNRSGMMTNASHHIGALKEPLQVPCYYPHYTFFMDYLGDVLLCPHDWGKKFIVGNINVQNFLEIWQHQLMSVARRRLASADRNLSPCDVCDVKGVLIGKQHVKAWREFDAAGNPGAERTPPRSSE